MVLMETVLGLNPLETLFRICSSENVGAVKLPGSLSARVVFRMCARRAGMALPEQLPAEALLCPSVLPATPCASGEPPLVILHLGALCFAGWEVFWECSLHSQVILPPLPTTHKRQGGTQAGNGSGVANRRELHIKCQLCLLRAHNI